jgi:hypothetical protein
MMNSQAGASRTAPKGHPGWFEHPRRDDMIALDAYLRAERRGFEPGHELEDWLAAQAEIDACLEGEHFSGD